MADVAFVLLAKPERPDPQKVIASAKKLGFSLTVVDGDGPQVFELGDGRSFFVMMIEAPHPDVPTMPFGPTSVPEEEAEASTAHLIVTAMGLAGTPRQIDTQMAALTAAVIENVSAVGAMLGHGAVMHKAKLFSALAALGAEGEIPAELAIDITTERVSETRMAIRTHNLPRYDREDFYVTCPIKGKGALDFIMGLARWMLTDPDKVLPTGETLGRTPDEKVRIHRVKSPEGETVIRLDLP